MKLIEVKCKNCGASLKVDKKSKEFTCKYCHSTYLLENEEENLNKIGKQEKTQKKERTLFEKIMLISIIIIVIMTLSVILWTFTLNKYTLEKIDVFEKVDISFSGNNCIGVININKKDGEEIDLSEFKFKKSKENLCNGDKITIEVIEADNEYKNNTQKMLNSKYFIQNNPKEFVVSGLNEYVKDVNELSEESIQKIHERTKSTQEDANKAYINLSTKRTYKPYKMYLLSDGKNHNLLYDIYERTYGSIHYYTVVYLENVIIYEDGRLEYSKMGYVKKGKRLDMYYSSNSAFENLEDIKNELYKNKQSKVWTFSER